MPDLDAISKVHPILVYYINMHTAAGNSAAAGPMASMCPSATIRAPRSQYS